MLKWGITFYNLLIVGSKVKVRCGDKEEGEVLTLLVLGRGSFLFTGKKTERRCLRCEEKRGLGSRARELVFTGHEFPSWNGRGLPTPSLEKWESWPKGFGEDILVLQSIC